MWRISLRTWGLALVVGALTTLLGYGLELVTGQAGWAVVGGSIGLCAGATFAGALVVRERAAAVPPAAPVETPSPPPTE
jgi:hypothetical protein